MGAGEAITSVARVSERLAVSFSLSSTTTPLLMVEGDGGGGTSSGPAMPVSLARTRRSQ